MASCNKGYGLFIVHSHTTKGFPNILGCGYRIRIPIRPFRIYIDKSHLHSSKWFFKVSIATISSIFKHVMLRAPINITSRLPYIFSSSSKTKGLESCRFQGDITSKYHQISPGYFTTVLLFNWP